MVNRIQKLIDKQKLTATQFANEIGVQRSAVSHLLSGRNKPSLDFVLKIKNRFPEINLEWLLLGSGKMIEVGQKDNLVTENRQENLLKDELNLETVKKTSNENEARETEIPFSVAKSEDPPPYHSLGLEKEKSPQKVILLFSDNTFKVFNAQ